MHNLKKGQIPQGLARVKGQGEEKEENESCAENFLDKRDGVLQKICYNSWEIAIDFEINGNHCVNNFIISEKLDSKGDEKKLLEMCGKIVGSIDCFEELMLE